MGINGYDLDATRWKNRYTVSLFFGGGVSKTLQILMQQMQKIWRFLSCVLVLLL